MRLNLSNQQNLHPLLMLDTHSRVRRLYICRLGASKKVPFLSDSSHTVQESKLCLPIIQTQCFPGPGRLLIDDALHTTRPWLKKRREWLRTHILAIGVRKDIQFH